MDNWVVEMQAMLDNHDNGRSQAEQLGRMKPSIYKIPLFIFTLNETAYQPRVVSFGPYHHGKSHLVLMEADKERALIHFIKQSGRSMQDVFDLVTEVASQLKDSYDSLDPKWKDDINGFVKMMILDGCFMLEVLQAYYSDDDPVFSRHGDIFVIPFIKADMLLLENQLPMSLLIMLKRISKNAELDIEELNKEILGFLDHDFRTYSKMGRCLHVLDLHRKGLLHTDNEHENTTPQSPDQGAPPSQNKRKGDHPKMGGGGCWNKRSRHHKRNNLKDAPSRSSSQGVKTGKRVGHNVVRPATELHECGVRFMKSESKGLRITFAGNVLKLPKFIVYDYTKSMFLNLIAFERCHIPINSDITSFVAFMDRIIDDSRDIKLLSSKGIIDNFIGTDKDAADVFNTMSRDLVMVMNDNIYGVYEKLIDYSNTKRNKWWANLRHTYFRNPWVIISVIAAFILFSLTTVQTIFTIIN